MKYKGKKGITLIALVITIIILLILAGVSIATLTGQNGLLGKANTAKIETKKASAKEKVQLAVMGSLDNTGEINNNELKTNLNKVEGIDKNTIPETITDDIYPFTVTIDGYEIQIDKNGRVTIIGENPGGETTDPADKETSAKDVLITNPQAGDEVGKSPYVKYNELLCRVLYNDKSHGIQIITVNNIEDVYLGNKDTMVSALDFTYSGKATINNDFKKAAASYNNVINNLNNKAKSHMDKNGIATDARCLGSAPILTSDSRFEVDTANFFSGSQNYLTTYSWNNKFKQDDTNYLEDVNQLNSLGLNVSSGYTWLASRLVLERPAATKGCVRWILSSGSTNDYLLWIVYDNGDVYDGVDYARGFRPVFLLPSNVVIKEGKGSLEEPYIID